MKIKQMRKKLISHIEQIKPNPLSKKQLKVCWNIIKRLSQEPQSGKELSLQTGLTPIELREHIMYIRREMVTMFQNPTGSYYIVASDKGYWLTDNIDELNKYKHNLDVRLNNLINQKLQLDLAIENKKK